MGPNDLAAGLHGAPAVATGAAMIRRVRETIWLWHARQHLRGLPDYLLRDIGIERSDILLATYCGRVPARCSSDAPDG